MMQGPWNIGVPTGIRPSKSAACSTIRRIARPNPDSFHIARKVPVGDTPIREGKTGPVEKAIALFWAAINAGDSVDSALKDMAAVMKQQNRATRLLGNLGWALMQKNDYVEAEAAYGRALRMGIDSNRMCNLGIGLTKQRRIAEAKETLKQARPAVVDSLSGADSHLKAYERALENAPGSRGQTLLRSHLRDNDRFDRNRLFDGMNCRTNINEFNDAILTAVLAPVLRG